MEDEDLLKLENAARNNDLGTVAHLINNKHVPDGRIKVARIAAEKGNLEILRYLIQRNLTDFERVVIVHTAIEFANLPVVKYFIEDEKVDVNIPNEFGEPPIFTALRCKQQDIFKYLVEERNANLTAIDARGNNILYVAAKNDDLLSSRYILDTRKAALDINWRNKVGDTVLHAAVLAVGSAQYDSFFFNWRNAIKMIEYLVKEKHANVNAVNNHRKTPLHQAALLSHVKICNLLMDYGADTMLKDAGGHNYWEIASLRKRRIRSIGQPFRAEDESVAPMLYNWWTEKRVLDNENTYRVTTESSGTLFYRDNPLSQFNVSHFAVIAQLLFKKRGRPHKELAVDRFTLSSPLDILRKKMDPLAINAVQGVSSSYYGYG